MINLKETVIGIELGSTRIKSVLLDRDYKPLCSGAFEWENHLENGIWTYSTEEIHKGLRECFSDLKKNVRSQYGVTLTETGAIGISAMMHGYLPFDHDGKQLCAFRTWRNTMTGAAAEKLTEAFGFNIPQRWSIAHVYQAILNGESHVKEIGYLTTLAGYIHWKLTGEKVVGVGEASGMFPVDSSTGDYDAAMIETFDRISGMPWQIMDILPKVLPAGTPAGNLTAEGAAFLDPEGDFLPGIPFAPCEGDAGTGMVATDSVREHTGNVSAGTSDFAMVVTDHTLRCHREIDMVTTPTGRPVAMVHCNNCTSDINAWVGLFSEFLGAMGNEVEKSRVFEILFQKAMEGDPDGGGLLSYNYYSGEGVTDIDEGRPVFVRKADAALTLANFMRTHLLSALSTLKWGLDILIREENVTVDRLYGHGGFFKTPKVGQRVLSAATGAPVSVMETAGEGGPYGMALLCAYMLWKDEGESLEDYLDHKVFAGAKTMTVSASEEEILGFDRFFNSYKSAFGIEKKAVEVF